MTLNELMTIANRCASAAKAARRAEDAMQKFGWWRQAHKVSLSASRLEAIRREAVWQANRLGEGKSGDA